MFAFILNITRFSGFGDLLFQYFYSLFQFFI